MLEVRNLDVVVGERYLVKELSFTLHKGDKLAIIGEEGNGKSTLLKVLFGTCSYAKISGTIDTKGNTVGYLSQTLEESYFENTVFEFLFPDLNHYYDYMNEYYRYMESLKLKDDILEQKMNQLSGGEKVKVQILKILLEHNDILLLDEPTNDLDIETLEWLEQFIKETTKPIIFVSHDETLLGNTANMILHLEQIRKKKCPRHTLLKSDYETYIEMRMNRLETQEKIAYHEKREYQKKREKLMHVMQKVEYQQNTISRSDPHGAKVLKKKMHTLKSQEKKLDTTVQTEFPDVEEGISFFFPPVKVPSKKVILHLDREELKVGNRVLSRHIHLEVIGPSHVAIIGKNGIGKTTLLKEIYQELKERSDINVGYMPQRYEDILEDNDTVLSVLPCNTKEEQTKARLYLGNMKFTQDEMTGKIKNLSGGTKAKLILMKLVMEQCDVLILDEPTRNVSPLSNPVIRSVLKEFQGAIISISHDRKYLDEVIDTIYRFDKDGLKREK